MRRDARHLLRLARVLRVRGVWVDDKDNQRVHWGIGELKSMDTEANNTDNTGGRLGLAFLGFFGSGPIAGRVGFGCMCGRFRLVEAMFRGPSAMLGCAP